MDLIFVIEKVAYISVSHMRRDSSSAHVLEERTHTKHTHRHAHKDRFVFALTTLMNQMLWSQIKMHTSD